MHLSLYETKRFSKKENRPIARFYYLEIRGVCYVAVNNIINNVIQRVFLFLNEQDFIIDFFEFFASYGKGLPPSALNQILSNLISNAIRYGSGSGIFGLTIREDGEEIAIDSWDRGKGIAEVILDAYSKGYTRWMMQEILNFNEAVLLKHYQALY